MTDRLYYRDATLLEFDAEVVDHAGDAHHVVLDRTAFYPTSGGQPHDTGTLGAARVTDVTEDAGRIVHVTSAPVPVGPIRGAVDADRRHDHMQQHSAQHLLSAVAADRLKWDTTSVHFGVDESSIELSAAAVSDRQLADLERWTNDLVAAARQVTVSFEDAGAAAGAGLRKASGRTGEIRVITIAGVDRSACGGTHVSRTSEIGAVMLHEVEKVRGNARVHFRAGERVLRHARASDTALAALAHDLGCAVAELATLVPTRQLELTEACNHVARLEQEVAASRVRTRYQATAPSADGVRRIIHRDRDDSTALLRAMAQAVAPLERAIWVAIGGSPAAIYLATSTDSGIDAGATLKPALAAVGGRGGGSAQLAQGTAGSGDALDQVAAQVLNA